MSPSDEEEGEEDNEIHNSENGPFFVSDEYGSLRAVFKDGGLAALAARSQDRARLPLYKTKLSTESLVVCTSIDMTEALAALAKEHELPFVRCTICRVK
jgi:hypothetical protein